MLVKLKKWVSFHIHHLRLKWSKNVIRRRRFMNVCAHKVKSILKYLGAFILISDHFQLWSRATYNFVPINYTKKIVNIKRENAFQYLKPRPKTTLIYYQFACISTVDSLLKYKFSLQTLFFSHNNIIFLMSNHTESVLLIECQKQPFIYPDLIISSDNNG